MALHLHRAERSGRLAAELGEVLRVPLRDPFTLEVVCVPTRGVERWLAQRLSTQLGVSDGRFDGLCAGVTFPSPRRLVGQALAGVLDPAAADPWDPRQSTWAILMVLEESWGEPWGAVLWSYLSRDPRPAGAPGAESRRPEIPIRADRRWPTAHQLAELFAAYADNRPTMLRAWLDGDDVDGSGDPLPPDLGWQPELWRRLRERLAAPDPAERLTAACAALVGKPDCVNLPPRLSVFGLTRLELAHEAVLSALAAHREVHLWVPHPSASLWAATAERLASVRPRRGPRRGDPTAGLPRHPLLAYLGGDARELQVCLAATGAVTTDSHHAAEPAPGRSTLLARVQDDIARDREPAGVDEPPIDPADRSIQVHACYGSDRQVEVLREVLLSLLADDPTLEPRDIVVMCPDIEVYAPLISAAFGLGGDSTIEHPGHSLRVRLADRSLRRVNPVLATLNRLLELADARLEASAVLDLAAAAPVAAKFGFTADELDRLSDLVTRSGVRWGLDAEHRRSFGLGDFGQNTWAAGLDRLLLGVTMDESDAHHIGTALPLDDVDSGDVDLVGRLAELVDRVRCAAAQLRQPQPVAGWVASCRRALDSLTAVGPADSWQLAVAHDELAGIAQAEADARFGEGVALSLGEVRALLADTFRGRATRANFRTGTLTMCTMLPMRSVPHRVVCLLGIDDGRFPRQTAADGDDILAKDPWVGDRDPRGEDRQLLLDALLAAEEHFVVLYSGADPRTGAGRPPAVPIGELLDVVDATARAAGGGSVIEQVLSTHPLQPFDPRNFQADPDRHPFSFDRAAAQGARALAVPERAAPTSVFDLAALDPVDPGETIALADLVRFFAHPAKALLRIRASLQLTGANEAPVDQIPIVVDPLQAWAMGDRLLSLHLQGVPLDRLAAAEWRRGTLPPRALGGRALGTVLDQVDEVARAARPFLEGAPVPCDVTARVGERIVAGTLSSVHGTTLVRVTYSRLAAKHRLQAWLELLALTVSQPDTDWRAVTVGRGGRSELGPVAANWAERVLADLVELYRTGLVRPLPFSPKAAAEYARLRFEGKSIDMFLPVVERYWEDDRDDIYSQVLGRTTLAELLAEPSVPAEERGDLAEPSRFGTLARRVWQPLLIHEVPGR